MHNYSVNYNKPWREVYVCVLMIFVENNEACKKLNPGMKKCNDKLNIEKAGLI